MSIVVIGLNHRSAPLDVLERLTVPDDLVVKVLDDLLSSPDLSEAVVVSTCNRLEVYGRTERFHPALADVRDVLERHSGLPFDEFADHLYVHHDEAAARHLFSVSCGVDSAVLGETEILGQVRRSFDVARDAGTVGSGLTALFSASSTAGRKVRARTGIARNITSVSRAAVAMASEHLGTLEGRTICVLGAGEMSEGMTVALRDGGTDQLIICNRSVDRAEQLAMRVGGRAVALDELAESIAAADVLLTGTGATTLMIGQVELAELMARRPDRPLLIVDIAVPRDVDPSAGEIAGVTLLDMDDLNAFAEAGRAERRSEIFAVNDLIDQEVDRFMASVAGRSVEPLLAAFRRDVERRRAEEVKRLGATLEAETQAQLDAATRSIVNKLLHQPMTELRDAAGTARGDRLAESLRELFDIGPED
jgi:glutamyl-tRNA reductase